MFLLTTSLRGVSSMKLHRDLGVTQKTACCLRTRRASRVRWRLMRPNMGGKRKNMSNATRRELADTGRGVVGKTAVVGAKDRATKQVAAKVVKRTDRETLEGFIKHVATDGSGFYIDEASVYDGLPNHETVKHSVSEYVRGQAHTNGVESFWSMLKRAHTGTFHKMSPKHLQRYVDEFSGRHNVRDYDTVDQLVAFCHGAESKRLRYVDLIEDNGLPSGARA